VKVKRFDSSRRYEERINGDAQPIHSEYQQYLGDEEINLLDYLVVLLKHKWLIFGIVFATGIAAIIISIRLPNIYRSEATIIPKQQEKSATSSALSALGAFGGMAEKLAGLGGGGDLDKFGVVLKSRELARSVVEKYEMMPELFEDRWNPLKKEWRQNPAPTIQDAYKILMSMLTVSQDRNAKIMIVKFDHQDPRFAKILVDRYLTELSELLRKETLSDASENKRFLQQQLEITSDPLLKVKIYDLLSREIERETFARAQRYYGFNLLDPPIASDLDKRVKPNRRRICILAVTAAGFLAICLAFFLEYINNVKKNGNGERLNNLRANLRFRKPKAL
jgi:uncharacterized protein involved in exopolysaccharide biosynthesis